ncbi:MAG TPA: hypothetical protein VKU40_11765, partial [Thermoanaerobaculia bacterium]|nr:hypothetical protein [Thermoanaerobaculia bacterium]
RYSVSPRHCLGVGLAVTDHRMPDAEDAALLLRATVTREGRIVAAQILHSTAEGTEERMVSFVKANTRLWRKDGVKSPFEAFVVFFTDADGSAGWMVAGSQPLV